MGNGDLPSQFSHDVKYEETAQGVRVHVHVYANDMKTAIDEAFNTYLLACKKLDDKEILRAPMEIKQPKEKEKSKDDK